jgi:hypothetical protein
MPIFEDHDYNSYWNIELQKNALVGCLVSTKNRTNQKAKPGNSEKARVRTCNKKESQLIQLAKACR